MAGKGFVDIELWQFAEEVVKAAKINLGASKKGRRSNTTGALKRSLRYKIGDDNTVTFYMEEYGAYVDSGRDGKSKKNRSKKGIISKGNTPRYPNIDSIKQWVQDKKLKPRNFKTGEFIPVTKSSLNSQAFLIARKIYEKGTKPTYFFSDPFREFSKNLADDIAEAVINDFNNNINI